ncbi:hypothetical protein Tco_0476235 [Tanacetum coccineum]
MKLRPIGNGSSCGESDMVIKDLDLELKVDAMMRDFLDPSWWKDLRKKMSSKILSCGDRSCWKTFKPVASLIAKGKLKKYRRILSLFSPSRSSESTSFKKSLREINGILVALMATFGVISKSTNRIRVSYGG